MSSLYRLPNLITLARILLIPIFVMAYLIFESHALAASIFAFAAFTDWLDGYVARSLQQASILGAFLDPVADKLMVSTALVMLVGQTDLPYLTLPAIIIVGREIVVSALREWMSQLGKKRKSLAVTFIAKCKTATQMLSITLLIYYLPTFSILWLYASTLLLYFSTVLTLWSMCHYVKKAWPYLMEEPPVADK